MLCNILLLPSAVIKVKVQKTYSEWFTYHLTMVTSWGQNSNKREWQGKFCDKQFGVVQVSAWLNLYYDQMQWVHFLA